MDGQRAVVAEKEPVVSEQGYSFIEPTRGAASIEDFNIIAHIIPEVKNIEAKLCEDPAKIAASLDRLDSFVALFPAHLHKMAGIEAIYVCESLKSFVTHTPAATLHSEGSTYIYINVATDDHKLIYAFAHELCHAIEYMDPVDEEEWAKINQNEPYLRDLAEPGDIVRYEPEMIPGSAPGFITDYARFSAKEDRAEIFAVLFTNKLLSSKEREAITADPIITEKVAFLDNYLERAGIPVSDIPRNF